MFLQFPSLSQVITVLSIQISLGQTNKSAPAPSTNMTRNHRRPTKNVGPQGEMQSNLFGVDLAPQ